jgi:hypothetical protein
MSLRSIIFFASPLNQDLKIKIKFTVEIPKVGEPVVRVILIIPNGRRFKIPHIAPNIAPVENELN